MNEKTKKLVISALLASLTTVATIVIKFPTPTLGYIHLGDSLVLLCGIILGPFGGALSAGIGSMFADIFSGYIAYAPATLLIKALTAMIAGCLFHRTSFNYTTKVIVAGIPSEIFMIMSYYLYEVFLIITSAQSTSNATLLSALSASLIGIPFNIAQGMVGIIIAIALLPIFLKIKDIREWITN